MEVIMTMVEKFGFPVCAAVWMTWYGWYMTNRYIAAVEAQASERTQAAVELVKNNAALATLSANSTMALSRNTESNDNLSSKLVDLGQKIEQLTSCQYVSNGVTPKRTSERG